MKQRPTIAMHGSLHVDNFGDILLARIFLNWLVEAGARVLVPSVAPNLLTQLGPVEQGSYDQADGLLYVGGGYFGEPPGGVVGRWRWGARMMHRHLEPCVSFQSRGRPWSIVGVGVGPISNRLARLRAVSLCNGAHQIAVRDQESAHYLRTYGVTRPIPVTADAAITMTGAGLSAEGAISERQLREWADGRPIVGLHYDQQSASDQQWQMLLAETTRWLQGRRAAILLIADQRDTPPAERQRADYQSLSKAFAHTRLCEYRGVDQLTGTLSACDLIVTTKFHVGIVGVGLGRAVVSLPCHTKTVRFYRQIGGHSLCLAASDWTPEALEAILHDGWNRLRDVVTLPDALLRASRANRDYVRSFVSACAGGERVS